jgi:hypothetical protein
MYRFSTFSTDVTDFSPDEALETILARTKDPSYPFIQGFATTNVIFHNVLLVVHFKWRCLLDEGYSPN